ncbi:MAG: hypothetical protein HQL53_09100 [Magnetococcales bacterium]|nr:hypothetical protein [Magnetococcales bacterium]
MGIIKWLKFNDNHTLLPIMSRRGSVIRPEMGYGCPRCRTIHPIKHFYRSRKVQGYTCKGRNFVLGHHGVYAIDIRGQLTNKEYRDHHENIQR